MIVTLTPNPSLDRTVQLDRLVPGAINRTGRARVEASGKGVNVSRVLRAHGVASVAVLPVGGAEGDHLLGLLATDWIPVHAVHVGGPVRVNVSVVTPGGETTKFNEPGPPLLAADLDALLTATADAVRGARWLVVAGTLPPGTDPQFVARVVAAAHAAGTKVAVDMSGPALTAAARAGADLLAPNTSELTETTGVPATTIADIVAAARVLATVRATPGIATVLVSMGGDGALLVTPERCLHGVPPDIDVVNTAGAGDALLAGWVAGDSPGNSTDEADRLARAVAWGTSACLAVGTADLPEHPVTADAVTIHNADSHPWRPAGTAS